MRLPLPPAQHQDDLGAPDMRTTVSAQCHTQDHTSCPHLYQRPRPGLTAGVLYIDQRTPAPGESLFLTKARCICACHSRAAITE